MDLRYERVLHRIAALIGGFAGAYTVLIRLNLGSSQTMNLLELLTGLLGKDYLQAALHFIGMLLYAGAVFTAVYLSKKGRIDMKLFSMAVNAAGFIVLGLLPADINRCVGLYPTFVMMSIQWVVFGSIGGYASSPIFSTNNLRQTVGALAEYVCDHKKEHLDKAKYFAGTLLFFHLGAVGGFFACKALGIKAAFFGIIPCAALAAVVLVSEYTKSTNDLPIEANEMDI